MTGSRSDDLVSGLRRRVITLLVSQCNGRVKLSERKLAEALLCDVSDASSTLVSLVQSGMMLTLEPVSGGVIISSLQPAKDRREDIVRVFEHWRDRLGSPRMTLTQNREAKIKARLAEGFDVAACCEAIEGVALSHWHTSNGYVDIPTIFVNRSKFETHRERYLAQGDREQQEWKNDLAEQGDHGRSDFGTDSVL